MGLSLGIPHACPEGTEKCVLMLLPLCPNVSEVEDNGWVDGCTRDNNAIQTSDMSDGFLRVQIY